MNFVAPLSLSASRIRELLSYPRAVEVLGDGALADGAGTIVTPPRTVSHMSEQWSVLLMPAASPSYWGAKIISVSPENPRRGRPRVEGTYVLFGGDTHQVLCLLDGAALTEIRTAAVSALAVTRLLGPDTDGVRLAVFGTGKQAVSHIEALGSVVDLASVHVWGSSPQSAARFADSYDLGIEVGVGTPEHLRAADLIACCTTSRRPLFPASLLDAQCLVAVGSHDAEAQELSGEAVGRCGTIVVEDRAVALREAGDIVQAVRGGHIDEDRLSDLASLVGGKVTVDRTAPRLFKSVGVGWQDLVLASAIYESARQAESP
ncbi:ornithine cyclodeaminase family protein [Streptomyces sp. NPDC054940]